MLTGHHKRGGGSRPPLQLTSPWFTFGVNHIERESIPQAGSSVPGDRHVPRAAVHGAVLAVLGRAALGGPPRVHRDRGGDASECEPMLHVGVPW